MTREHVAPIIAEWLRTGAKRAYPYYMGQILRGPEDLVLPRSSTPVFCGFFDWHSAVHSHWSMLRLGGFDDHLDQAFTQDKLAAEVDYLRLNPHFELPYGIAWLCLLGAETRGTRWQEPLRPLVDLGWRHLASWLESLRCPVRSGEHSQSGFAMTVAIDACRRTGDEKRRAWLADHARRLHGGDRIGSLHLEPSAYDFLSPTLSVAELMSQCLAPLEFGRWLDDWIPGGLPDQFVPVTAIDRSNGKLAHWDGLNLSRAWMLARIASALPPNEPRAESLRTSAAEHARAGMTCLESSHYATTHWLGSFVLRWLEFEL